MCDTSPCVGAAVMRTLHRPHHVVICRTARLLCSNVQSTRLHQCDGCKTLTLWQEAPHADLTPHSKLRFGMRVPRMQSRVQGEL